MLGLPLQLTCTCNLRSNVRPLVHAIYLLACYLWLLTTDTQGHQMMLADITPARDCCCVCAHAGTRLTQRKCLPGSWSRHAGTDAASARDIC